MAKWYDLSDEERREIGRYLDNESDTEERGMLKSNKGEMFGNRDAYSIVGAIWDLATGGIEYLEFDIKRALANVLRRIDEEK